MADLWRTCGGPLVSGHDGESSHTKSLMNPGYSRGELLRGSGADGVDDREGDAMSDLWQGTREGGCVKGCFLCRGDRVPVMPVGSSRVGRELCERLSCEGGAPCACALYARDPG